MNYTPATTLRSREQACAVLHGISQACYLLISAYVNVILFLDTGKRWETDTALSFTSIRWIRAFQQPECWEKQSGEIDFLSCEKRRKFNTSAVSPGSLAGSGISISKYKRLRSGNTRSSNANDSWSLLGAWKQVGSDGLGKMRLGQDCFLNWINSVGVWRRGGSLNEKEWPPEIFQRPRKGRFFMPALVSAAPWWIDESPGRQNFWKGRWPSMDRQTVQTVCYRTKSSFIKWVSRTLCICIVEVYVCVCVCTREHTCAQACTHMRVSTCVQIRRQLQLLYGSWVSKLRSSCSCGKHFGDRAIPGQNPFKAKVLQSQSRDLNFTSWHILCMWPLM